MRMRLFFSFFPILQEWMEDQGKESIEVLGGKSRTSLANNTEIKRSKETIMERDFMTHWSLAHLLSLDQAINARNRALFFP